MLSRYQHSIGIYGYDLDAIDSFMKKQEVRCHVGEISARELRNIRRVMKVMIDYVANDIIDTATTAYGTTISVKKQFAF